MRRCREAAERGLHAEERGSAVVEFVLLGALLFVPVVYFVLTVGVLQGASFAATGAVDHAAKVFVRAPDQATGESAARAAVQVAMADFSMDSATWSLSVSCDRPSCLEAGTAVTVTVLVEVPLPLAPRLAPPAGPGALTVGRIGASSTQIVGRFR